MGGGGLANVTGQIGLEQAGKGLELKTETGFLIEVKKMKE